MEVLLGALASPLKKLVTDMAEEEVSMLLGVPDEITKLEDNMEGIKAFLADAERRRLTDQSVQRWVRKLKDAMYDATDIIDLCQLELDDRKESTEGGSGVKEKVPTVGCFQRLLFCLRNPVFAHKIGSQIKELNKRLDDIHKEARNFNFDINLGSNPEPRKLTDAERSLQKMTSEFDESAIAGEKIEQDTRELAQLLISSSNHDIKVVSIVGTGGMGKTTLAQKILKEITVQEHFKVKVWLSITQHFDKVEMLRTAIKHAGGHVGDEHDETLLTRTLTDSLSTGRFLLILDDMWSVQAWSHVLSVPTRNASQKQHGNWVLITTRLEDVAQRMGASFYQHHVSPLNEEDAWSLLNKQLPPSPNQLVNHPSSLHRNRSFIIIGGSHRHRRGSSHRLVRPVSEGHRSLHLYQVIDVVITLLRITVHLQALLHLHGQEAERASYLPGQKYETEGNQRVVWCI